MTELNPTAENRKSLRIWLQVILEKLTLQPYPDVGVKSTSCESSRLGNASSGIFCFGTGLHYHFESYTAAILI
jgi:hypothetical protein